MKLQKVMVHVRLGKRIFDRMQTIQLYKSKTATAIIEDALEKGLAWYLKQAQSELGYTKENPLTWEKLAERVKLSVITNKDDNPEHQEEKEKEYSNYEVEYALYDLHKDKYKDFPSYVKERLQNKMITIEIAKEIMNEHVQNTNRPKEATKTKI